MKKPIIFASALLIASPAFAWNSGYNSYGTPEPGYDQAEAQMQAERNEQYPYESTTGTRYKYELSNPSDQIEYSVDPAAQLMDTVNPMVDIDRQMGQYGGGAE